MTEFAEIPSEIKAEKASILLKIQAVEFALGSFADYENEEERKDFLKKNFISVPGLKTYFSFSVDKLQDALGKKENQLQKKENLLLEKENLLLAQKKGSNFYT